MYERRSIQRNACNYCAAHHRTDYKNSNVDDEKAISRFYQSKLYQELSDEKSKLWHYSPMTLYTMYQDELLTGSYDYPEEA